MLSRKAVVMGALSPRTRNAQVALYEAREVQYLVATDAIGMGLNLPIQRVVFTADACPLDLLDLLRLECQHGLVVDAGQGGPETAGYLHPLRLAAGFRSLGGDG